MQYASNLGILNNLRLELIEKLVSYRYRYVLFPKGIFSVGHIFYNTSLKPIVYSFEDYPRHYKKSFKAINILMSTPQTIHYCFLCDLSNSKFY